LSRIVFTNGCFDILHRGHIELLRYCASLGQVIVGLNSDASVKRLKGETRPINKVEDRKFLLESTKFVSQVHIFEEDTPLKLIEKLKPDLIVKGGDYVTDSVIGKEMCEVIIFPLITGYSTSNLARQISFGEQQD